MYEYLNINTNQNINLYKGYSPSKLIFSDHKVDKIIIKDEKNNVVLSLKHLIIFVLVV